LTIPSCSEANTAETIFPTRRVGYLRNGYEASFLVLSGDPMKDFTIVQKIEMRVKQGQVVCAPGLV
jgi:imidazolonepropionase-like amidohydrolase